ncbi:MAG: hypothetical protein K0U98_05930 [Deltaproteobacteria bacterium]|nr:hypothetical protein [Deltaproteobacteria bacterium]
MSKSDLKSRLESISRALVSLTCRDQWVVWRFETREGKATKVPCDPAAKRRASTTDPSTWGSFDQALSAFNQALSAFRTSEKLDGIGYVFSKGDPFCGVDLDDCLGEDGHLLPWAREIVEQLDTYTEISPSGRGLKLFLEGELPPGRRRKGNVEMYDAGRYFTVTGDHFPGTPTEVKKRQAQLMALHGSLFATAQVAITASDSSVQESASFLDDQKLLEKARRAKNGDKFCALFDHGDTSSYEGDDSRADLALCSILAFWCEGDSVGIDRLFRQSKLMRGKWDSQRGESTYGARTIAAACELVGESGAQDESTSHSSRKKPTQAQLLVELVTDWELFHTADGTAYATVSIHDHSETWPVRSSVSKRLLVRRFFAVHDKPPGSQALQDALLLLEARAQFDSCEKSVHLRVAQQEGTIYLDLANPKWECVEITSREWRVVSDAPVKFRRTPGMLPIPVPQPGGSLAELQTYINVPDSKGFVLTVSWLLGSLRPSGPYAVLILQGEQGSAKSTTARVLRSFVDPSVSPVRTLPRQERDLMIAAHNAWILAFDNLSTVPLWLSDGLCRLATGGGFSTRALYSDDEERIFEAQRPVLLNGIAELGSRQDLSDRSIVVSLPPIPSSERRTEKELSKALEAARPRILGALCDAVSCGLRHLSEVELPNHPRMADFATWIAAAEPALPWAPGEFLASYGGNRADAIELALESDPVSVAIRQLLSLADTWMGTATELLGDLDRQVSDVIRSSRAWPKAANRLTERLRRAATFLRSAGIDIQFNQQPGTGSRRVISIRKVAQTIDASDAAGAMEQETPAGVNGVDCVDQMRSVSGAIFVGSKPEVDEVVL